MIGSVSQSGNFGDIAPIRRSGRVESLAPAQVEELVRGLDPSQRHQLASFNGQASGDIQSLKSLQALSEPAGSIRRGLEVGGGLGMTAEQLQQQLSVVADPGQRQLLTAELGRLGQCAAPESEASPTPTPSKSGQAAESGLVERVKKMVRSAIQNCAEKTLKLAREAAKALEAAESNPNIASKLKFLGPYGNMLAGVGNALRAATEGDLPTMLANFVKALDGLRKGLSGLFKGSSLLKLAGREVPLLGEGLCLWDAYSARNKAARAKDPNVASLWLFVAAANETAAVFMTLKDVAIVGEVGSLGTATAAAGPAMAVGAAVGAGFAAVGDMVATCLDS